MIIESFSFRRFFVSIFYFSMCRSFLVMFYSSLLFGSSVVFSSPESPLPCSSLWLWSFIMEFQFSVSLHSPKNILKIHIWLQWVLLSRFLLRLFFPWTDSNLLQAWYLFSWDVHFSYHPSWFQMVGGFFRLILSVHSFGWTERRRSSIPGCQYSI